MKAVATVRSLWKDASPDREAKERMCIEERQGKSNVSREGGGEEEEASQQSDKG